MVTGYLKPDSGSIRYSGRDITQLPPRTITQLGICRSFQIPQLFNTLSVRENLLVALGVVVIGARKFCRRQHRRSGSRRRHRGRNARAFSARRSPRQGRGLLPEGMRKLLDIAMAMVVKPRVLLLDEPTSGVSADEKFASWTW